MLNMMLVVLMEHAASGVRCAHTVFGVSDAECGGSGAYIESGVSGANTESGVSVVDAEFFVNDAVSGVSVAGNCISCQWC